MPSLSLSRRIFLIPLLALQLMLAIAATSAARTITWSGYNWDVRPAGTAQAPGPNDWSDSSANVQVQGSDLLLSIVKDSSGNWASSEVDNQQHLGYGTYRWVVDTDLSALDANEVLGMFTYGGSAPSNNEIDIEPSHWGSLSYMTGSATVWQNADAGVSEEHGFNYSSHPPYVNQFTWAPGRVDYLITDAAGATLFAWTVTSGVPTPSTEVPMINYWRFNNIAPASVRTVRIASFAWAPPGQTLPPVKNLPAASPPPLGPGGPAAGRPGGSGSSSATAPAAARAPRVSCTLAPQRTRSSRVGRRRQVKFTLTMPAGRFLRAGLARDGVFDWRATGFARLELIIRRSTRGHGFIRAGALLRSAYRGAGVFHLPPSLGGHSMGPGTYSVQPRASGWSTRCTPGRLRFTVT